VDPLEAYCRKALEMGIDEAKVVAPSSVTTAEWVRMKCQFGCSRYGKGLCCPPYSPPPDRTRKVLDSYQNAILLHKKFKGREMATGFNETMVRLEREIFLDGCYKAWSMGTGPCRICEECDPKGLCRYGFRARPSMEACGIDVFRTARENGFSVEVVRTHDKERNHFGLVLVE
jgi:predicted metal-binding protein